MNYEIFNQMNEGEYMQQEGESEQGYMERIFRSVVEADSGQQGKSLNEILEPEYYGCDAREQSITLRFTPQAWQLNPMGRLHGGMVATTMDTALGLIARYCIRNSESVTVQLNISYMRGISSTDSFLVTAKAAKNGRKLRFLMAETVNEVTGKKVAEATAVFL
ncbi:MAG: PaaI family thioesterase [Clostridiales bacterium]|nr:PaaI family thioesterase [Clostridiales bacterium]